MPDYKIDIGTQVRDRLAADPGVLKLPAHRLDIFVARDFLTAAECAALVRQIDARRKPSQLLSPTDDPEFRTSESCDLDPRDRMVLQVEARIRLLTGIAATHGETIQGQRYAVGQQFKPHHDYFLTDQPYWEEMDRSGGQRTWTAMVFLNTPAAGGQTAFPSLDLKIAPRAGNLLIWNNLDAYGLPNPYSLHQGLPVIEGVKYVITKWHRERPWGAWSAPTY
ncbi:2OG-Fe(II) oxygenase [Sphingosinicella sp. LHD-64]|uniref:prolyl hydroxylase family protein n=1 Tax=Sphingosinicella sp. LHD-64 TaxID=3072139 RepID=UPI00280EC2A3|nr:2OG-Fe(II) oxygenase [Sphingosinicella sp. LHD-64]MDQ8756876.1 2OG-Fe(II) oxygenase [Sphingosinicella sp. LHD-64]